MGLSPGVILAGPLRKDLQELRLHLAALYRSGQQAVAYVISALGAPHATRLQVMTARFLSCAIVRIRHLFERYPLWVMRSDDAPNRYWRTDGDYVDNLMIDQDKLAAWLMEDAPLRITVFFEAAAFAAFSPMTVVHDPKYPNQMQLWWFDPSDASTRLGIWPEVIITSYERDPEFPNRPGYIPSFATEYLETDARLLQPDDPLRRHLEEERRRPPRPIPGQDSPRFIALPSIQTDLPGSPPPELLVIDFVRTNIQQQIHAAFAPHYQGVIPIRQHLYDSMMARTYGAVDAALRAFLECAEEMCRSYFEHHAQVYVYLGQGGLYRMARVDGVRMTNAREWFASPNGSVQPRFAVRVSLEDLDHEGIYIKVAEGREYLVDDDNWFHWQAEWPQMDPRKQIRYSRMPVSLPPAPPS